MLKGKKTYLIGVLFFALGGLHAIGIIDDATYQTILSFLAGAGVMTMRAGLKNEVDNIR